MRHCARRPLRARRGDGDGGGPELEWVDRLLGEALLFLLRLDARGLLRFVSLDFGVDAKASRTNHRDYQERGDPARAEQHGSPSGTREDATGVAAPTQWPAYVSRARTPAFAWAVT